MKKIIAIIMLTVFPVFLFANEGDLGRQLKLLEKLCLESFSMSYQYDSEGAEKEDHKLNVNVATSKELQTLKGIGPKTAEAMISYRESRGGFKNLDDIINVKGIGPSKLATIRPYITVSDKPESQGSGKLELKIKTINNLTLNISSEILADGTLKKLDFLIDFLKNTPTGSATFHGYIQIVNNLMTKLNMKLNVSQNPEEQQEINQRIASLQEVHTLLADSASEDQSELIETPSDNTENTEEETPAEQPSKPENNNGYASEVTGPESDVNDDSVEFAFVTAIPAPSSQNNVPPKEIVLKFNKKVVASADFFVQPLGKKKTYNENNEMVFLPMRPLEGTTYVIGNEVHFVLHNKPGFGHQFIVKADDILSIDGKLLKVEFSFGTENMLSDNNIEKGIKTIDTISKVTTKILPLLTLLFGI